MAAPKRIFGTGLKLKIGTTDFYDNTVEWTLESSPADSDLQTFADVANGGSNDWALKIKAVQSTDPSSLMMYLFDHAGEEAAYEVAPHGNATATATQPHFKGTGTLPDVSRIGGAAGKKAYEFEVEMALTGKPAKVTQ
ncbi:hypothetical protein [Boudabousia marimammalium]|uniref:Phage tail protein n=1 Tax=Boudabousia marimammalium TaxID=156892 RepID=A0A1Q5PP56_9ACTO|nr:hypothetical protein [Boudabousia marimammalium]OKL49296.1 hypothetical protein BM477_04760 [Boudabousia marimammalium]